MDPRQLEVVVQFAKFLELMSKPEDVKQLIKDANDYLKAQQDVLGIVNTKAKADQYKASIEAECDKKKLALELEKSNFQTYVNQKTEELNKTNIEANKLKEENIKVRDSLIQSQTEASNYNKRAKEAYEEVLKQDAVLKAKAAELAAKENDLQAKADKLKQLLG